MKIFLIIFLLICTISSEAVAYPNTQLKECILSSKQNPIILGTPEDNISGFCDCSLQLIIDEGKGIESSANECAAKYFK